MSSKIDKLIKIVIQILSEQQRMLVLAESCTAGRVVDMLGSIPGVSKVLWGAFVCYSNDAKSRMLGLKPEFITTYGAVSKEVAEAMVYGALEKSMADVALAITGLAGPDGDGSGLPVGTVWISAGLKNSALISRCFSFSGSREAVRKAATIEGLQIVRESLLETIVYE
jgi:PncC family amidohydrolase